MFHVLLIKILEFLFWAFRAIIALLSSIIICSFNNFLILPRALKYLDPVEGSYGSKSIKTSPPPKKRKKKPIKPVRMVQQQHSSEICWRGKWKWGLAEWHQHQLCRKRLMDTSHPGVSLSSCLPQGRRQIRAGASSLRHSSPPQAAPPRQGFIHAFINSFVFPRFPVGSLQSQAPFNISFYTWSLYSIWE